MYARPQPPATGQPTGTAHPPTATPSPARPPVLYVVLCLLGLGSVLTFIDWYLDRRYLAEMFWASDEMLEIMPTFNIVRLVVSALGVIVALGLFVATFLGANWARVLLAIACFGYALANLGSGLAAAFVFVAGRGAFNEGGDTASTSSTVLNGLSMAIDVLLFLMVVACAIILLTGRTKAYTKPGAGTR
ncbi:hypothetical protein [Micromonospora sp. HM5-17]|uniref:hypothetical protein n=1 Tax=Micromonospora sp. HM5-17 TaxID=2487710 RepID=UPI0011CEA687|nr:hypothetical protein [Micromonospora sp. HM5-17]